MNGSIFLVILIFWILLDLLYFVFNMSQEESPDDDGGLTNLRDDTKLCTTTEKKQKNTRSVNWATETLGNTAQISNSHIDESDDVSSIEVDTPCTSSEAKRRAASRSFNKPPVLPRGAVLLKNLNDSTDTAKVVHQPSRAQKSGAVQPIPGKLADRKNPTGSLDQIPKPKTDLVRASQASRIPVPTRKWIKCADSSNGNLSGRRAPLEKCLQPTSKSEAGSKLTETHIQRAEARKMKWTMHLEGKDDGHAAEIGASTSQGRRGDTMASGTAGGDASRIVARFPPGTVFFCHILRASFHYQSQRAQRLGCKIEELREDNSNGKKEIECMKSVVEAEKARNEELQKRLKESREKAELMSRNAQKKIRIAEKEKKETKQELEDRAVEVEFYEAEIVRNRTELFRGLRTERELLSTLANTKRRRVELEEERKAWQQMIEKEKLAIQETQSKYETVLVLMKEKKLSRERDALLIELAEINEKVRKSRQFMINLKKLLEYPLAFIRVWHILAYCMNVNRYPASFWSQLGGWSEPISIIIHTPFSLRITFV